MQGLVPHSWATTGTPQNKRQILILEQGKVPKLASDVDFEVEDFGVVKLKRCVHVFSSLLITLKIHKAEIELQRSDRKENRLNK